jgi:hypothetical protein
MPANPDRAAKGGDVAGTCKTNNDWGVGSATTVAEASYDPGYSEMDATLKAGYFSMADVKQGYCSYGVGTGEARPKGIIGGK